MFETSFNVTEIYLNPGGDTLAAKLRLFAEIENNYLKILRVFEFNGFHEGGGLR